MHSGLLLMPRTFHETELSLDGKLFKAYLHIYSSDKMKKEEEDTEGNAPLLINTKLPAGVTCHQAVLEKTRRAHINHQPSAGHCFALITTGTYVFPRQQSGIKISEAQWQCRVIMNQRTRAEDSRC